MFSKIECKLHNKSEIHNNATRSKFKWRCYIIGNYYLAMRSSHFTIPSIKPIEMKQTIAKTLHVAANEIV